MKITNNFLLLPTDKIDVRELLVANGKTDDEIHQTLTTTGFTHLSNSDNSSLTHFILNGLKKITDKHNDIFENIDAVIVVSQSYDQRIPSISSRIQKLYNLAETTFCIDIMDGCSGYIKALYLAGMLEKQGYRNALIISGDLNSTMTEFSDLGTKVLFGDGLSVSILESCNTDLVVKLFNDGDIKNTIGCDTKENIMLMNGFEVFRFTRNNVPKMLNGFLNSTNQCINDFDLVALHQASNLVVSTISKMLKLKNRLLPDFTCGEIGNLGAGSIGAWLSQGDNLTQKGDLTLLAVGFGSGLSWGLGSLTVNLKRNEVIYV